MENRIILITGATGGIGKAAAVALAKQGATVIIHGRNQQKTEQVRDEIIKVSGNNRIDILVADLFLLKEVRKMAAEFKAKYDRLDVLINNAGGIMSNQRENTAEGIEKTLAVNVFAPFLLTNLLLDQLQRSKNARIINVASNSHKLNAKPDFEDLQLVQHYNPLRAYGNAKLFLIWITRHLSAQLKKSGIGHVNAYTMHPGAVATSFGVNSNLGPILNTLVKVMRRFFRTAEQGADTLVYLATADKIPGSGGGYFVDRKPAQITEKYATPEREQQVWDYCGQITGA